MNDIEIPRFVIERHKAQGTRGINSRSRRIEEIEDDKRLAEQKAKFVTRNEEIVNVTNKKRSENVMFKKGALVGAALTLAIIGGAKYVDRPSKVARIPYCDTKVSFDELAKIYDVDPNFLLKYNDVDCSEDLLDKGTVDIPSSFDYLQDEIDDIQTSIYKGRYSDEGVMEKEGLLAELLEKQELQQNIADVYTDGKNVYYYLFPDEEFAQEYFPYGINVEHFKEIFDIKDGALSAWYNKNDLSSEWAQNTGEEIPDGAKDGYLDWTKNRFYPGKILKVKTHQVKTDDINLDYNKESH